MKKSIMNNKIFTCLIFCLALMILGCSKDNSVSQKLTQNKQGSVLSNDAGATQISGVGFVYADDPCDALGQGAAYAISMGMYKGQTGTFWTNYKFEAKYEGCAENGSYVGAEIKGRCKHPIVKGSGTGAFEGVTGRLAFIDDVEVGNYPYRGHLQF